MNLPVIRVAGPIQSGVILALAVGMPMLWWSPKTWVSIAAVAVWFIMMFLASATRRKKEAISGWVLLAMTLIVYLGFAVLAFCFRA